MSKTFDALSVNSDSDSTNVKEDNFGDESLSNNSSSLNGYKIRCTRCVLGWILGTILATILLITCIIVLSKMSTILYMVITQQAVLEPGTKMFDAWSYPPVPVYLSIHLFHILNPLEVKQGSKPALELRGPFVYEENRTKEVINLNSKNDTLKYTEKIYYYYRPHMSNGNLSDMITTFNLVYLAVTDKSTSFFTQIIFDLFGEKLFVNKTVKELIWGYQNKMLKSGKVILPSSIKSSIIGYFVDKNGTESKQNEIYTGENKPEYLGKIKTIDNKTELDCWATPAANAINGSDGTLYPTLMNANKPLYIYNADISRSIYLEYTKETTIHGITARLYTVPAKLFESPIINEDNRGFCPTYPDGCLNSGVLSLEPCVNAPIIVSQPHFYEADQEYQNGVEGLNPTPEMSTELYLEPSLSVVLRARKQMQINAMVKKKAFGDLRNVIDQTLVPLFYITEKGEITEELADQLKKRILTPIAAAPIVLQSAIGVLTVILVLLFTFGALKYFKRNENINISKL